MCVLSQKLKTMKAVEDPVPSMSCPAFQGGHAIMSGKAGNPKDGDDGKAYFQEHHDRWDIHRSVYCIAASLTYD